MQKQILLQMLILHLDMEHIILLHIIIQLQKIQEITEINLS